MKLPKLLGAMALAVATTTPVLFLAPAATAATPVQVRVADLYTYDSGNIMEKAICVDGSLLVSWQHANEVTGPYAMESGTHTATVYFGEDDTCSGQADRMFDFTLTDDPNQTLMIYWPADSDIGSTVFADDTDCLPAGQGRVVYRSGATYFPPTPTDLNALVGLGKSPLVTNVASGGQGSALVAPGAYEVEFDWSSDGSVVGVVGADLQVTAGTVSYVYSLGGADGSVDGILFPNIAVGTCSQETTTTTTLAATTTTVATVPAAARPVRATPTYTG